MSPASTSQNNDDDPSQIDPLIDFSVPTVTPDTDISSDSDTRKPKTLSKARAKKAHKAYKKVLSASKPHQNSLRPANDVLSRIRHDPALDVDHFIVGYKDRHEDVMEMPVAMWGGDITEEDFIPQHRILYFRRKEDGVRVWDRKERVDMLFGSGNGNGDRQKERDEEEGRREVRIEDGEREQAKNKVNDADDEANQKGPLNETEPKGEKIEAGYEDAVTSLLM